MRFKTKNKINIYDNKAIRCISGKVNQVGKDNRVYINFNSRIVSFNTINYFSNLDDVFLDYFNGVIAIPLHLLEVYYKSPSSNKSFKIKE